MNIEKNLQKSIDLYLTGNNFGIIFITSLAASILSAISLGILAGPLFGGLIMLILKLLRNKPTEFNEIFSHFDKFLPTLLVCLASGIISLIAGNIPVIGVFLGIVLNPFILVITSVAIILIIEKDYTPLTALKEGFAYFKTEPLIIWIYGLIASILSAIGVLAFGIGVILTIPFSVICMAVAYQEYFDKEYFEVSGSNLHQPPV